MNLLKRRTACLALAATPVAMSSSVQRVRVSAAENLDDPRFTYANALLKLALVEAGWAVELEPRTGMTQQRRVRELQDGFLDVSQLPASGLGNTFELLPVRIPIRRGLLGLRLFLARSQDAQSVSQLRSLRELQASYRLGFGADWSDLKSMRDAGFRVDAPTSYHKLFKQLELGQCDLLSRSVSEIWDELATPSLAGGGRFAVVSKLALYYPLDDFFWVNPRRKDLQQAILTGLERLRGNGKFQRLYQQTFGQAIERAGLAARRIWVLPHVAAPEHTSMEMFDAVQGLKLEQAE